MHAATMHFYFRISEKSPTVDKTKQNKTKESEYSLIYKGRKTIQKGNETTISSTATITTLPRQNTMSIAH
jgi:hypothetical protein